jgi:hypothetical protein
VKEGASGRMRSRIFHESLGKSAYAGVYPNLQGLREILTRRKQGPKGGTLNPMYSPVWFEKKDDQLVTAGMPRRRYFPLRYRCLVHDPLATPFRPRRVRDLILPAQTHCQCSWHHCAWKVQIWNNGSQAPRPRTLPDHYHAHGRGRSAKATS